MGVKQQKHTTIHYPFSNYEVKNGTSTKHIFLEDKLIATMEGSNTNTSTYYNHLDHLGSTKLVTDNTGQVVQRLEYYPYGGIRVDEQYGSHNQTNRYTGHEYDGESKLSYMGARYQSGDTGRFISQDPVSLSLGDWRTVQDKTRNKLGFYLKNPQTHNSYSYTANNPIKYVDENGEYIETIVDIGFIIYDIFKIGHAAATGGDVGSEVAFLAADVGGLFLPGTGFGLAGRIAAKGGDEFVQGAIKVSDLGLDSANTKSVQNTLDRIKNGDTSAFKEDGTIFQNKEGLLPEGNYKEYTVETPGLNHRGQQRVVQNADTGETYYTGDHYKTFKKIKED